MTKKARPVRDFLRSGSVLLSHVRSGISALPEAHRALIDGHLHGSLVDSMNLDEALRASHPNQHRWDYLVGCRLDDSVVAIETHSANTSEVSEVIRKKLAAQQQLEPHRAEGARVTRWIWVASGNVSMFPFERAMNRLAQNGIQFAGRRILKKHLG